MNILDGASLDALRSARLDLQRAAARAAASGSPRDNAATQQAMTAAARHAIFADALLAASKARLEALKGLAK